MKQQDSLTDIALKELVFYRILTLKQILALSGLKDEKWAREQLKKLLSQGFVYRRHMVAAGREASIYQLLPEGKKYLQESGVAVPYVVQNLHKLQTLSPMHIRHTLGVNEIFIRLFLLTKHYEDRFALLKRIHERSMSQFLTKTDGGVEPDGFAYMKITHHGRFEPQSFFIEYERTTSFSDMGEYQQKIMNYLRLFENTSRLELLFGVKYPSLMTVVDNPVRVPILAQYSAQVLRDFKKTEWESRFLFSSLDTSLTPVQFFCSHRWLRSWLPIPPSVPYFTDQDDLLQSHV